MVEVADEATSEADEATAETLTDADGGTRVTLGKYHQLFCALEA